MFSKNNLFVASTALLILILLYVPFHLKGTNDCVLNAFLHKNFDTPGNRCYVFSDELQKCCFQDCHKKQTCQINNLSLNLDVVKSLGGKHLFSAVAVNNAMEIGLKFERRFESTTAMYNIYLYKI